MAGCEKHGGYDATCGCRKTFRGNVDGRAVTVHTRGTRYGPPGTPIPPRGRVQR